MPRARQAPDVCPSGGTPSTDSSRINRRDDWRPLVRYAAYQNCPWPRDARAQKTLDTENHINAKAQQRSRTTADLHLTTVHQTRSVPPAAAVAG
jgi:hypothetical protein